MRTSLFTVLVALAVAVGLPARRVAAQEIPPAGHKANLDLPALASGDESDDEEESPETVVFFGQVYEGSGIILCFPKLSGCDGGVAFRRIQREVVKNLSGFTDKVEFGIVMFDHQVQRFPSSGQPARASPLMKKAGTALVMAARPGGAACAKPGLLSSLALAERSGVRHRLILFVSDGWNHCPGYNLTAYENEVLAEVRSRNSQRITINTIGVSPGHDLNEDFLKKLAEENGGVYRRAGS